MYKQQLIFSLIITLLFTNNQAWADNYFLSGFKQNPYQYQILQNEKLLNNKSCKIVVRAIEALGYLRSYDSTDKVQLLASNSDINIRREAIMMLSWCGSRRHIKVILNALTDSDWSVRQAAAVSFYNMTGVEFPFDAISAPEKYTKQANAMKKWWKSQIDNNLKFYHNLAIKQNPFQLNDDELQKLEGIIRALGILNIPRSSKKIITVLQPFLKKQKVVKNQNLKTLLQAGIRALGRLQEKEAYPLLIAFLDKPQWAHYAAEALGDYGDKRAFYQLAKTLPKYAVSVTGKKPTKASAYDIPRLSPVDRMYIAPFSFSFAMTRLSDHSQQQKQVLIKLAPLFIVNIPGDFDAAFVYQHESWQKIFAYLLELSGLRKDICDIAFNHLGEKRDLKDSEELNQIKKFITPKFKNDNFSHISNFAATWIAALCAEKESTTSLIALLKHHDRWVRMNAVKTLMLLECTDAAPIIFNILKNSKTEAEFGYCGTFKFRRTHADGQDEYNDVCPRWREAFVTCLAKLQYKKAVPLLIKITNDDRNVLEVRYAATEALGILATPQALKALQQIEHNHPFHLIKICAREALWKHNIPTITAEHHEIRPLIGKKISAGKTYNKIIFIKGSKNTPNYYQIDNWRQIYSTTDSGPTYRLGNNIYSLSPPTPQGKLTQLTNYKTGYVADIEISWDAKKIIFCKRGGKTDPWWHIFEMNIDGSNCKQLTFGPYHDVQPNYLPDGRIVFSSSRMGARDEYHGYLATGLTIMNPDGSDIHCIAFNLGRDSEPTILNDGRIGFSRLELFYSRMKTEWNIEAVYPDGTRNVVLYGPEFRQFWYDYTRKEGINWVINGLRHRTLRIAQISSYDKDHIIAITQKGLTLVGPGRNNQTFIPHDQKQAVTTPFPLPDGNILCSAGEKNQYIINKRTEKKRKTNCLPIDLGIYIANPKTGKLTLVYNDPEKADFEARPVLTRTPPNMPAESEASRSSRYTGTIICENARFSQEKLTTKRGRYIRIVEGLPSISRHQTHTYGKNNHPGIAWRNHTGLKTRVWGTFPLGTDGSFNLEVPADRFFHCQILDSDRRVVGNQLIWMYVRPGENKSCVGCHESPNSTPLLTKFAKTATKHPLKALPYGQEFMYRAKFWDKGYLPSEGEERVRTARAINLMSRQ